MLSSLKTSKDYRSAFIEECIRTRITAQIKALRDTRGLDYKGFAEEINKSVSWTYRLEDPNAAPPTIPTLLQIANAFDIGLDVRFRPFSELLDDVTTLNRKSFRVPCFDEELKMGSFSRSRSRRKVRSPSPRRKPKVSDSSRINESKGVGVGASGGVLQWLGKAS
jgi:transcriptional regulator with XRE-family HTH domain